MPLGIGAGKFCDGQILNLYDMLDVYPEKKTKVCKNLQLMVPLKMYKKICWRSKKWYFSDENYSYWLINFNEFQVQETT